MTKLSSFRRLRQRGNLLLAGPAGIICLILSGCAAVTSPVAEGVPVRHLPAELLAKPKDVEHTIPLDLLG